MALTPRQAAFVREYLADSSLNATAAALRAGYSSKSATVNAARLMGLPAVRAAIDAALDARAARVEVKADDILRELLALARADVGTAFGPKGELLPLARMPEATRRAIAGLEVTSRDDGSVVTKVKWWDKTKGLELLGKHLGLFVDRVQHEGKLTLEQLVLEARKPK